jgi:hypothetical protein
MAEDRQKSSKDKGGSSQAIGPDDTECKRLRDRAVSRGNLARAKASPVESLLPSKGRLSRIFQEAHDDLPIPSALCRKLVVHSVSTSRNQLKKYS